MKKFILASLILILTTLTFPLGATKIGYALSGGGARGFAQIGVLKVLEEYGIYPDYISGTSIGAVVGALYAMGYSAQDIEDLSLLVDWQSIFADGFERKDLHVGQKRWTPYGNLLFELDENWKPQLPQSVFTANNINLELFRLFASTSNIEHFADLPIPFTCVATNLLSGSMKVFHNGSLMQAVKASMSIPSIMKPFELNDSLYIDGGISQNMPVEQVIEMGADFVISMKTNSDLREASRINNLFQVFDQSLNIGITKNVNESMALSDFHLEPYLDGFEASSFGSIKIIIDAGEAYARSRIAEIIELRDRLNRNPSYQNRPKKVEPMYSVKISKFSVVGNHYINRAKVKEYMGVEIDGTYSKSRLVQMCRSAWNLQLFHYIYPIIVLEDGQWHLIVYLKERERKHLATNITYTSEDDLAAGVVLAMNNYFGKNSKLLVEAKVGGKNEVNVDFVKNFGELWGIYYRLFTYLNEKTLYIYEDHYKTNSIGSLETGLTAGLGFFANKLASLEGYSYHYSNKLSRKISETDPLGQRNTVTGLGIKIYHESTDDYYFPMEGSSGISKLSFSRNVLQHDDIYGKFTLNAESYMPFSKSLCLRLGFDYGANFSKSDDLAFDPFYFGGSDGFLGHQKYEISAPFYKVYTIGFRYKVPKATFIDIGVQGLNHASSDIWTPNQNMFGALYASIGINSIAGPMRFMLSLSEDKRVNTYLNLGYTADVFKFSRR